MKKMKSRTCNNSLTNIKKKQYTSSNIINDLSKRIKSKVYNFGSYKSLEKAKRARKYFQTKGWDNCLNERLKFTCKKPKYIIYLKNKRVYQIRKKINGELIIFGQFKDYNEAEKEVELLIKSDWDFQVLCDLYE